MITKSVNLEQDANYQALFNEIKTASNNTISINSPEDYFGNVKEIANLDIKFLRMPLDEPMFEIDANTRKISVPSDFKSNGLSVQGDHLAETVYFKIDRFFDFKDLSDTDITINWKMGTTVGKTRNFSMSKTAYPGYLVFGWPVDKDITAKSGDLTFAVEFSKTNNGELIYSFNTLSASISIKDGLVITSATVKDLSDSVKGMLVNSSFGSGEAAVGDASWLSGEENNVFVGMTLDPFTNAAVRTANLNTVINADSEPESEALNLYGRAYVDASTTMTYFDGIGNAISTQNLKVGEENVGTADAPIMLDVMADVAVYSVDEAGSYQLCAQGVKRNGSGVKIGAGNVLNSVAVVVPEVEAPSVVAVVSNQFDEEELEDYKDMGYTFEEGNYVYLVDDATLEATVSGENLGAVKIDWYKDGAEKQVGAWSIDATTKNKSSLAITEAGVYKAQAKNFINDGMSSAVNSAEFTASELASEISAVAIKYYDATNSGYVAIPSTGVSYYPGGSIAKQSVKVKVTSVTLPENAKSSEIKYQWYMANEITDNTVWTKISTAEEISINTEGYYRVEVMNVYNGSVFTFGEASDYFLANERNS